MITATTQNAIPSGLLESWVKVSGAFRLRTEADYRRMNAKIDRLVDLIGDDRRHPLYSLLDTLGTLVHAYEEEHEPLPEGTPMDVLKALMVEHGLSQRDLPEIGSQGVVSEILHGKRTLNVRQVAALAKRFAVSPAVFI
jgi:HTH-type transcriptional regulator/antitoxin HigA